MGHRIAVAGGTGVLGSHVVEVAGLRGHDVVTLSRGTGVDRLPAPASTERSTELRRWST